jgi:hypothetical protein
MEDLMSCPICEFGIIGPEGCPGCGNGMPEEIEEYEEEEPRTPKEQARYERWLQGIHGHPDDQVDLWKLFGIEKRS